VHITDENYLPGTIWFVSNYNFGLGIPTRDKYVIILKVDKASEQVCFALCTTRSRFRSTDHPTHGCNKFPGLSTNIFEAGHVIGEHYAFAFFEHTHVYHAYDLYVAHYSDLEVYHIDSRVEICDIMAPDELQAFLDCIRESDSAKRGLKRFLFG
jgi:hypothetical protein